MVMLQTRLLTGLSLSYFQIFQHYYEGDRTQAIIHKANTFKDEFREWFRNYTNRSANEVLDHHREAVDFLFDINPKLQEIGTKEEYSSYISEIFPESKVTDIYWHGTNSDFTDI